MIRYDFGAADGRQAAILRSKLRPNNCR